jgi:hypothetical protein
MVHKASLFALIFLLLGGAVFCAVSGDVLLGFTLPNAAPEVNVSAGPAGPAAGPITFTGGATYSDPELENGTVNMTWYLNGLPVGNTTYFSDVVSGSTVPANPYSGTFSQGDTVSMCADVSDGHYVVTQCAIMTVSAPGTTPTTPSTSSCSISISSTGGNCPGSQLSLEFTRQGSLAGAFTLIIKKPDGSMQSIPIESSRPSYIIVPNATGSYFIGGATVNGCLVSGISKNVGGITPVVYSPICSFTREDSNSQVETTGDLTTIYIVNENGIRQGGTINVSWVQGGKRYEVSKQGALFSFVPESTESHHVSVIASGCMAGMDFTPNVCQGNVTNETVVIHEMEGKKYYIWMLPQYLMQNATCSMVSCRSSADCCEGYCQKGGCVVPAPGGQAATGLNQATIGLKEGCFGLFACGINDILCTIICNLVWVILIAASIIAAYFRKGSTQLAALLLLAPFIVAFVSYPILGLILSIIEALAAFYQTEIELRKKK